MRVLVLLLALLAAAPVLAQTTPGDIDVRIDVPAGTPTVAGDGARFVNVTPGERASFELNLTKDYTTFEVRIRGAFDVERIRQVVPKIDIPLTDPMCAKHTGPCDFPLFEQFPNERIWDVDGPARVFHVNGTTDDIVLRLGVPGPVNATLVLERDVTPPNFTLRRYQDLTPIGFYQEAITGELALADLQVREKGASEWIQNPTTAYHFYHRFPVQGLDANTTYEQRLVVVDWAGNEVTSPTYLLTTPPEPARPVPVVRPLEPQPNATVGRGAVVVKASYSSPDSPVRPDGVRLFFDLKEVSESVNFGEGEVSYVVPGELSAGVHRVSVEITNEAGGRGLARWSFEVGGAKVGNVGVAFLAISALVGSLLLRRR